MTEIITNTKQNCMIAVIEQGTARYGELKDKMIKDKIEEMTKNGYICDKNNNCVKDTKEQKANTSVVENVTLKATNA